MKPKSRSAASKRNESSCSVDDFKNSRKSSEDGSPSHTGVPADLKGVHPLAVQLVEPEVDVGILVVHRADADHTLFEHLSACQRLRIVNVPKSIDFGTAERQAAMERNPSRVEHMPKWGS